MAEAFIDTGKEDRSIRFHLLSDDDVRVRCNGEGVKPCDNIKYTFPAGLIRLEVFEKGNYKIPLLDQTAFFHPGWSGIFLLKETGIQALSDENMTVLPEKGHFRIVNLLKESVSVRRTGGNEIFTDVQDVTPYRLAGVGRYRLQFFSCGEKIGEKELWVNEGSKGSVLIKKNEVSYIEEFSI